ncbi:BnaA02g05730D [Brassica napus]|uniref:BnaA02g05730D protein n=1 Tax=Brassica napus TaxID=3708 RepID=A0A078F7S8_BRANA|nr:BnaA02g05730D [Brassica napus]
MAKTSTLNSMNTSHEKAVQAILYGQSCAKRLKLQLDHPMADGRSDNFFSDLSSRDSSSSSSPPLPQRSHSKKRKNNNTNSSENWRHDSPDPNYYDGFLWRKYGQKTIKQSKHQRSYYRCSYNIDHACGARKHEQKIKDNPPVYRTTYFGHHTCNINHNQDAGLTTVGDSVNDLENSRMIWFGEDLDQEKESHTSGLSVSVKHEEGSIKEETVDQYRHRGITSHDKDCQNVIKENHQPSPSGSYTPPSSSGSEIDMFDSDLLVEDLDLWDRYDMYDFGLR